jgi:ADP-ribosylation factor 1/2
VESVKYKNIVFTYWDVGGQEKIRKLWYHYYTGTDAVIFVIDSNDADRIEEAKRELYGVMEHDELRNCPLLVYANKQDLPHSLSASEVVSKLDLASKMRSHQWHCQGAVAVSGEGLYEGLDWLSSTLQNQQRRS